MRFGIHFCVCVIALGTCASGCLNGQKMLPPRPARADTRRPNARLAEIPQRAAPLAANAVPGWQTPRQDPSRVQLATMRVHEQALPATAATPSQPTTDIEPAPHSPKRLLGDERQFPPPAPRQRTIPLDMLSPYSLSPMSAPASSTPPAPPAIPNHEAKSAPAVVVPAQAVVPAKSQDELCQLRDRVTGLELQLDSDKKNRAGEVRKLEQVASELAHIKAQTEALQTQVVAMRERTHKLDKHDAEALREVVSRLEQIVRRSLPKDVP